MFQPRVKLAFVERYCPPAAGWLVFADIDPSEEGRTGGDRKTPEALARQADMQRDAALVRQRFAELGVHVGEKAGNWKKAFGTTVPTVEGDRDILAVHLEHKRLLVVEVEGVSSGQPEQKLYKAIGQVVIAASVCELPGYDRTLVVAVHGSEMKRHLARAKALERIGVAGLHVAVDAKEDELILRPACWFTDCWGNRRE
jgi:hypothetical protein